MDLEDAPQSLEDSTRQSQHLPVHVSAPPAALIGGDSPGTGLSRRASWGRTALEGRCGLGSSQTGKTLKKIIQTELNWIFWGLKL